MTKMSREIGVFYELLVADLPVDGSFDEIRGHLFKIRRLVCFHVLPVLEGDGEETVRPPSTWPALYAPVIEGQMTDDSDYSNTE